MHSQQTILVAGATSEMVLETLRIWASRNFHFHLLGRDKACMEDLSADLLARGAGRVTISVFDITDHSSHENVLQNAWAEHGGFDIVLMACGVLGIQANYQAAPQTAKSCFDVNLAGPSGFLLHVANQIRGRKGACIAIIGSVAGDRGRAGNFVYGAAKAGIEAFASGLRAWLHADGVQVCLIKPGMVATRMTASLPQGILFSSATTVGRLISKAVDRRLSVVYIPSWWQLVMIVIALLPGSIFNRLRF
jgi:decaprenylphospho-beta-D-erythro-pentofuranosid-2-ulose 2-reductase